MKAVVQNYRSGLVRVAEIPAPQCSANGILVRTSASLISIGTERSMVELGRRSLLGKARARPDLVKRAVEKARREGFWKVFQESLARLDAPVPLGYSSAGMVVEAGVGADGFAPGDRVACVGHPFASHAEFVAVPANMACRIPENVADEEAAFGMLGAIAMHGVRSTQLAFGGTVTVIGLGLLGILTAQILRAYGCRVVGVDPDEFKVGVCRELGIGDVVTGAEEVQDIVSRGTQGMGCDAVIVAAAAASSEPVSMAVGLCRERGRVVILGVADIHPDRNEMWKKEIDIVVSKAGGPGALDPMYELEGIDLPISIARWTQGRNVEEFLRLIAERRVVVDRLISQRVPIAEAATVYSGLANGQLKNAVGILLTYPQTASASRRVTVAAQRRTMPGALRLAVLGAGAYGRSVFLPVLCRQEGIDLNVLVTGSGVSSEHSARKFGFQECSTDSDGVFEREDVDAVIALTPHSRHAQAVMAALKNGKHLLVEKPLCVTPEELGQIEAALAESSPPPVIMVGHNRRYSSHTLKIKEWLAERRAPVVLAIRVNAGFVPADHWVHSEREGRSRIVGEGTHFIDLATAIVGAEITSVHAMRVGGDDKTVINSDNYGALLRFTEGSIASLVYQAQGSRDVPREVIEIHSEGKTIISTDFRRTEVHRQGGRKRFSTGTQNYGYEGEIAHFVAAAKGLHTPQPTLTDMIHTMRVIFAIECSLAKGMEVSV